MKLVNARPFALATVIVCLALSNGPDWIVTPTAGQAVEKRWILLFHQQSAVPDDAAAMVAGAGGSVLAQLPEVGALVALSSDPNFAARVAQESKVADVVEDLEFQMIPGHDRLQPQVLFESDVIAAAAAEPPGDDTQTGPD